MIRLHVNVDHVATLRQQRDTIYPDPVLAAGLCELAGADGITAHLREDRRHIQERDVRLLRQTVRGVLNLEMAAVPSIVDLALQIKPDFCTLVPEKREERTTEGGLDLRGQGAAIGRTVRTLRDAGIGVSLFIDPEEDAARASADLGAVCAELHTGDYCHAPVHSVAARRELASRDRIRGEITLLVQAPPQTGAKAVGATHEKIADRVARIQSESGIDEKEALKRLARELGQSKSDVYRELQRERAPRRTGSR